MYIFLTQLQGYITMFKLMDDYAQKKNSDDLLGLLSSMCFLSDGRTADSAMWEDWLEAIFEKETLTKQEAFDGMIKFLEIYRDLTSSADASLLINKLRSAKGCDDMLDPLVKQWSLYLNEMLRKSEDSREYLKFVKE